MNWSIKFNSIQICQQFLGFLTLQTYQANTVIFERGSPNSALHFLLDGRIAVFYEKESTRFSQLSMPLLGKEPQLNIAQICSIKKRVSLLRSNSINLDDHFKLIYHQKYGNHTRFFDPGQMLDEKSAFRFQQKTYTAVSMIDCQLAVFRHEDFEELQNLHEQHTRIKKKFLEEVFRYYITPYDLMAITYLVNRIPVFGSWRGLYYQVVHFEKGQLVAKQGQQVSSLFVVYEGEVRVSWSSQEEVVQIGILGRGEFLNETFPYPSPYNAEVVSLGATVLEIRKDVFQQFPYNCKKLISTSSKLKQNQREQFVLNQLESKRSRKQRNNEQESGVMAQMKFMEKSGEGTKLESVFRTFIQVRVSNDEFMSVDDLVDAIRKVEVDTEKKAERFDFGTGEIEKQEQQERFFKIRTQRLPLPQYLPRKQQLSSSWKKILTEHYNKKQRGNLKLSSPVQFRAATMHSQSPSIISSEKVFFSPHHRHAKQNAGTMKPGNFTSSPSLRQTILDKPKLVQFASEKQIDINNSSKKKPDSVKILMDQSEEKSPSAKKSRFERLAYHHEMHKKLIKSIHSLTACLQKRK